METDQYRQAGIYAVYCATRTVFQYEPGNAVFDPMTGYRLRPGLTTGFANKEFSTTVRTNSLGFRDDEASLQKSRCVVLLAISYLWGWV